MKFTLINNSSYPEEKVNYVLSFIFSRFKSINGFVTVKYGEGEGEGDVFIKSSPLSDYSLLFNKIACEKNYGLDVFEKSVSINFDLIDMIYSILNETSSWMPVKYDKHNRILPLEDFDYSLPVLDVLIDSLRTILGKVIDEEVTYLKERGTCSISHDIDNIKAFGKPINIARSLKRVLSKGSLPYKVSSTFRYFKDLVTFNDPYYNFDFIMKEAGSRGLTSNFYFMAGGCTRFDGRYSLSHYSKLLNSIAKQGHVVGLHPSYDSVYLEQQLKKEIATFEKLAGFKCDDIRFHYLRFNSETIVQDLTDNYIKTDISLGFASKIGFRNGTCYPFFKWDEANNCQAKTLYFPLAYMDTTALGYLSLTAEEAMEELKKIVSKVNLYKGHLDLLWHNSNMYFYNNINEKKLFIKAVDLLVKELEPKSIKGFL